MLRPFERFCFFFSAVLISCVSRGYADCNVGAADKTFTTRSKLLTVSVPNGASWKQKPSSALELHLDLTSEERSSQVLVDWMDGELTAQTEIDAFMERCSAKAREEVKGSEVVEEKRPLPHFPGVQARYTRVCGTCEPDLDCCKYQLCFLHGGRQFDVTGWSYPDDCSIEEMDEIFRSLSPESPAR